MSSITFDAIGVADVREVPQAREALVQPQAPRLTPFCEVPAAPARARRARNFFGLGSAVSHECTSWLRWTGV